MNITGEQAAIIILVVTLVQTLIIIVLSFAQYQSIPMAKVRDLVQSLKEVANTTPTPIDDTLTDALDIFVEKVLANIKPQEPTVTIHTPLDVKSTSTN